MRLPLPLLVAASVAFGSAGFPVSADARDAAPAPTGAWLGVQLGAADLLASDEDRADPDATPAAGALVTGVMKDSPADRAGVRSGDLVLRLGTTSIATPSDLQRAVASHPPGGWSELEIKRGAQRRTLTLRLGERTEAAARGELRRPYIGAVAIDVPLQLRTYWGGSETRGVLVGEVAEGGPAARGGLRPGDLVLRIGGRSVGSSREFVTRVQLGGVGNRVEVEVSRQGTALTLEIDLEDAPAPEAAESGRPERRGPRGNR